jgi:hypothetical protein
MTRPSRQTILVNLLCLAVLAWLYGGDLVDALRARSAEVSAFLAPPPVVWPSVVLAATLGAVGVGLWGLVRGRGEGFKGYRLLPIVLVSALFFDLVIAESQVPLRPEDVSFMSLGQFRDKAQLLARGGKVPASPEVLRPVVEAMGQPPYLVRGVRASAWSLQVRQGCEGPVQQAPGLEVGTFIYCVAPGGERAWVSLVALPAGKRFGLPEVFSSEGLTSFALVRPESPDEEQLPPGPGVPAGGEPGGPAPLGGPRPPDVEERVPAPTP